MTAWVVQFLPAARKALDRLPEPIRSRIRRATDSLAANPRLAGCSKVVAVDSTWRIRVGEYRIVYEVHDAKLIVLVVRVGHRREVYRRI